VADNIPGKPEPDNGKPRDEKEIREQLYADWKRLGLKTIDLDSALLVSQKPKQLLGARQILLHDQDFIRLHQYSAGYHYSRRDVAGAYDAKLGLIDLVASDSAYNPFFKLDESKVSGAKALRQDIQFLSEILSSFAKGDIIGGGAEIRAVKQFYKRRGYDPRMDPYTLLDEIRRVFENSVDDLMVRCKLALYPLASSRRNQPGGPQSGSGREDGADEPPPPSSDVASLALGAVSGVRAPRENREEE
jgi:hypothetical protein